jgi:hypothetical protein
MKKLFLILAVLIGVSVASLSFASNMEVGSDMFYNRTVQFKSGFVYHANTLITAKGGVLRYISGDASSANAVWTIYDSATVAGAGGANSQTGILIEGGQATQYGSIGPIDLGSQGITFVNGLVVITTTADLTVLYY